MRILIGLIIGIIWLIACCIVNGKIKIRRERTAMNVITVIVFIVFAAVFLGIGAASAWINSAVPENAVLLEKYLKDSYGDSRLVRDGLETAGIPQGIGELEAMVPGSVSEFGISNAFVDKIYKKAVNSAFASIRARTDLIISFANADGKVTVSTLVKALEWVIYDYMSRLIIRSTLIISAVMVLFLCLCIFLAARKPGESVVYGND
ncbi:MAG: hypothetical protein FWH38_05560 [Treponema sp.]|nr:hypothetical protein [Treponema sp.]